MSNTKEWNAENWIPKTELGRKVMNGEITNINQIFNEGYIIREPEIVDMLVPDIAEEILFTGGHPGKGGGKRRTPIRITMRMHKSGRKRTVNILVAVGNKNGLLGLGYASGKTVREVMKKANHNAKLNITPIRRGCGSWECGCKGHHSIPFKTEGRTGSVKVKLMPAPKGTELCVSEETKKLMGLAGISDIWSKSFGQTKTRVNFIIAGFNALKNLNNVKIDEKIIEKTGMKEGVV